ncbi:MAG: hypothetical protein M5U34_45275 [Chloroflexi bacterium]|nr:hypothetical protein [Chloroflexota bacterium]
MQPNKQPIPFINVRTQENRTPTGRRTSTPAKRAALYYAYGNQRNVGDKEAQLEGRQRGEWLGPDGRIHTQEEVMAWVKAKAMEHRYTFQGILSVPEGELTAAEFGQAMQRATRQKIGGSSPMMTRRTGTPTSCGLATNA